MPNFIVEHVWPTCRVHLVGGVPDAGKTRWVIPALLDVERGLPLLGKQSTPVPWAYVAGDRLLIEAHDTLKDMGISPSHVRIIPAFGQDNKNWAEALLAAEKLSPVPELLVFEGFQDQCGDSKKEVRDFLGSISAACQPSKQFPNGLTIIGICESPKMKPAERYRNPRQRVSGVSAWAYHTGTIIMVEAEAGDDELATPYRTMWVCMKGALRRKLRAVFDTQGRLIVP
jgi:hypothetical protein